jgi:hypothetical protein
MKLASGTHGSDECPDHEQWQEKLTRVVLISAVRLNSSP